MVRIDPERPTARPCGTQRALRASGAPTTSVTIYGCAPNEAALFHALAPRFCVVPTITEAPVWERNIDLASGTRCSSIGHKSDVTNATLLALSRSDVKYISTRSVGCNHIDVDDADSIGLAIETVVYSPDKARGLSSAYRKLHTSWQRAAAFNGGVAYTERARTAPRRIRIRKARVAGLLIVVVAITAVSLESRGSSLRDSVSSTVTAPVRAVRGARPGRLIDRGSASVTGRLGLGEADGAVPDGTTVFDDTVPGVARLNSHLLSAVRRAATDAARDGVQFYVDSGWRSKEYQQRLVNEAIAKYGSEAEALRWVATPETSAHVKGDAVDIGPTGAASWLSEHGAAYGLCRAYGNEPWHYELRPDAIAHGCPAVYADPTHDPRMQR
jgi:hypothetical protein